MLKNAPPAVKQTDMERHTEKFYRVKNHINTSYRYRHQKVVAAKIVKQKEISMLSQSSYTHKASMTLLNSERRTQLQVSPLSMSSRTRQSKDFSVKNGRIMSARSSRVINDFND